MAVLVYALVSLETRRTVETFPTREEAEADLQEVLAEDPELADLLRVEPVILPFCPN
jgi:hypothetical protein